MYLHLSNIGERANLLVEVCNEIRQQVVIRLAVELSIDETGLASKDKQHAAVWF